MNDTIDGIEFHNSIEDKPKTDLLKSLETKSTKDEVRKFLQLATDQRTTNKKT